MTGIPALLIPGTRCTPTVLLDPAAGRTVIFGNSLPENAHGFYLPILEWLDRHLAHLPQGTVFEFRLPYFNTSSMKALFMVLQRIGRGGADNPWAIGIEWHVEDDDEFMIEAGEDLRDLLDLPLREVRLSAEAARAENDAVQVLFIQRQAAA